MKIFSNFSIYSLLLLFSINVFSQTAIEFKKSSYEFDIMSNVKQQVAIPVVIKGILAATQNNIVVSIVRNDNASIYSLVSSTFSLSETTSEANVYFQIQPGILKQKADTIILAFTDPITSHIRTTNIYIKTQEEKSEVKESKKGRIMYLNAYNFDFGGNLNGSNYVGHLNIFSPAMGKSEKWGFNSGIMKINYSQKDTAFDSDPIIKENIFINPFDTLGFGLKYLRKISRYSTIKKNQIWSFYFQPMYQLNDKEDASKILFHMHTELLASKWTATTTSTSIAQDTGVIGSVIPNGFLIRHNFNPKSVYTINSLSAYFGAGLTYDMKLWNKGEFIIQSTIGVTSNQLAPTSTDLDAINIPNGSPKNPLVRRTWASFYLIRANYIQKLSENSNVVIGTDIRGFLNNYAPQYAAYVGLNVGLDAVLKILTGDKKD